ncbi:hypothetical protein AcW1_010005 [Taiwanofungus camphoratus]|nr:hypothetical protein AcV7_005350 [Antrodia cinnamomea]KAI0946575.1 hypothetical protein AcW1_010005 [Antrodia cinnamomea]
MLAHSVVFASANAVGTRALYKRRREQLILKLSSTKFCIYGTEQCIYALTKAMSNMEGMAEPTPSYSNFDIS